MAITYGLTPQGLVVKTLTVIRADIDAAVRSRLGASLTLGDSSVLGIIDGIMAERYAELWSLVQSVYSSQDPDSATSASLDALARLTGSLRPQATFSTVTETFVGLPSSSIPTATTVATASTGIAFVTTMDGTTSALTAWAATTSYAEGDRVTNVGNAYQCTVAGTSAGSGGPNGADPTNPTETDDTVTWYFLGVGTAATDVLMAGQASGPSAASAFDLTDVTTPVSGINAAINMADALLGTAQATDAQFRILRQAELSVEGGGVADAIRAAILEITDVTSCTVLYNDGDFTDGNGVPPHSVEALVLGGNDVDVANVLYAQVPAGIGTYGTTPITVTDSQGNPHTISFSRPVAVPIFVRLALTYDATQYPADGDVEVNTAIATAGQSYVTDQSVYAAKVESTIYSVPGVLDSQIDIYTDVIGTPVAWAGTTGYSATVGSRSVVSNDGGRHYVCITSGTSAGSGGPTGTATDITDGTVHWRFLGATIAVDSVHIATWSTLDFVVTSTPV